MLLATSCSKDELDTASSGNEAQVTFSLGLEGRIATRAISDGGSADKLVYAVFDEDGNRISGIKKVEKTSVSFPATETLSLAKGKTYKVAFWAQDADCGAYAIDDNMNVTVSYDNATNNDETRDAFFKTTDAFTVTGSTSMDVVLKRPFAQINVGVESDDWDAAVASGVTIQNSSVVIKNAATKINLVTGAVSDPKEVTYSLATIPEEDLSVDVNGDEVKETYKWLSMSYILVDDESEAEGVQSAQKATLEGLEFTFKPTAGNDIILKDGLNSVPVQRNWRTNILGKLLTGDITFTIKIDPNYDGDNNVFPVGDAQSLMKAIEQGGTVTLTDDVDLSENLVISGGETVTINLNGHDITNNNINTSANATTGVFIVKSGGNLTIQGEGIINGGSGSTNNLAVWAYPGSEVNISGGTFTVGKDKNGDGNSTIYTTGGTINISGGTFKTECDDTKYILNVGQTQGATGTIIVTGGTFIGYDPATGDDNLGGSFVAEGYTSVKVAGTNNSYAVVPSSATIDENTVAAVDATSFTAAVNNKNANIVLNEDIQINNGISISSSKEIDLNNNTLQVTYIDTTAPLTVKNGNLDASNFALRGYAKANITLDNVKVTATRDGGIAIQLGDINGNEQNCGDAQLTLKNSEIVSNGTGILIYGANNKVKIEDTIINHKYFGITQNGTVPGSEIELTNCTISGTYSGIYLSNYDDGAKNILEVEGGSIHSDEESAIEVKKTDITVKNATLSSSATAQSYTVKSGGSNGIGYAIVLAGYEEGTKYEGVTSFENITYNLSAQGDNVVKILKYNGSSGEKVE